MGFADRQHTIRQWREKDNEIQDYEKESSIVSARTASPEKYLEYCRVTLKYLPCLLQFYTGQNNRYRRLALRSYFKDQKGIKTLVTDILGHGPGSKARILVAHGGSGMSSGFGCKPVGNKRILRELMNRATVMIVGEYNTSKNCCACFCEMKGEVIEAEDVNGKKYRYYSYGVRRCTNNECRRGLWDRDVSDGNFATLSLSNVKMQL